MEEAVLVVEPEQERADDASPPTRSGIRPTTQSAVRRRLTFCIPVRSPER